MESHTQFHSRMDNVSFLIWELARIDLSCSVVIRKNRIGVGNVRIM
jgi:hypothetical protein